MPRKKNTKSTTKQIIDQADKKSDAWIKGAQAQVRKQREVYEKFKHEHQREISYLKRALNETKQITKRAIDTTKQVGSSAVRVGQSVVKPIAPAVKELTEDYHFKKSNLLGATIMRINPFLGYATAKITEKYGDEIKELFRKGASTISTKTKEFFSKNKKVVK